MKTKEAPLTGNEVCRRDLKTLSINTKECRNDRNHVDSFGGHPNIELLEFQIACLCCSGALILKPQVVVYIIPSLLEQLTLLSLLFTM